MKLRKSQGKLIRYAAAAIFAGVLIACGWAAYVAGHLYKNAGIITIVNRASVPIKNVTLENAGRIYEEGGIRPGDSGQVVFKTINRGTKVKIFFSNGTSNQIDFECDNTMTAYRRHLVIDDKKISFGKPASGTVLVPGQ